MKHRGIQERQERKIILSDITYGNRLLVTVGFWGTIITSIDGITWTPRTSGTSKSLIVVKHP